MKRVASVVKRFPLIRSRSDGPRQQRSEDHAEDGADPRISREGTGSSGTPDEAIRSVTEQATDNYANTDSNNHFHSAFSFSYLMATCSPSNFWGTLRDGPVFGYGV